ncbi:MAG: LytTR family DNA-binding domain-containing protein [Clostridiales bacterium]|nr:LytTR family DNA-binding domain-containing protein [Clostridiales bacterium]
MRIAICDDDPLWCEQAEKIITEYMQKTHMEAETHRFTSGEAMFAQMEQPPDVLFLDIELGADANGIQTAALVNEKWRRCQIVYLTDYLNYATHVYHTEHAFYLLKNEFADRVGEVFQRIDFRRRQNASELMFSLSKGGMIVLLPEEIQYFERKKRETEIYTESTVWTVRENLSEAMRQLSETEFVRCHNSYLVHFSAVKEYQREYFLLKNGVRLKISRSYSRKVRDVFLQWARMQMSE